MVVDMHFHLDERMMTVNSLIQKMDECGIDRVALIACMNDPLTEPSELLIKAGQFLIEHSLTRNIAKNIVSRFTPEGDIRLPAGIFKNLP